MTSTPRQSSATMPYNTRRKSLSLTEMGIIAPKRARVAVQPSPPNTAVDGEEPPVKKSKRSHGSASPTIGDMSPPRSTTIRIKEQKPKRGAALSPPPSPLREGQSKIDIEGISDEIVVGAIQQLEKTGNRPHLVKELSSVLATTIPAIERSANPSALISSRLTAYLNRSWPAISPCPLAKDLSPVHPRRLFFYLTTMPAQPLIETVEPIPKHNRIISPSLSSASAADEEDERYNRARAALSPSPEVDLSSPELDDDNAQPSNGSFSGRNSLSREHPPTSANLAHNRRAASPQLELEERDFKQTANLLHEQARLRRASEEDVKMDDSVAGAELESAGVAVSVENSANEEEQDTEAAAELFQHAEHLRPYARANLDFSSPVLQPTRSLDLMEASISGSPLKHQRRDECMEDPMALDLNDMSNDQPIPSLEQPDAFAWDSLQSPENIELSELDDMFDAFP
ncbi:hypothetical protein Q7P35_009136 [Cladosporium inversicolor]